MMFAALLLAFGMVTSLSIPSDEIDEFNSHINLTSHPNFKLIPFGNCGKRKTIQSISTRIAGGIDAEIEKFPWMVKFHQDSTMENDPPSCGGALINERYVLTAGHCCENRLNETWSLSVELGNKYTFKKSPIIAVEEIKIHWNYFNINEDAAKNDICLLRLKETIQYNDNVQPICLPFFENRPNITPGTEMEVAGWGLIPADSRAAYKWPRILQHKNVSVLSIPECRRGPSFMTVVDYREICVYGGICGGDSGGPLMKSYPDHENKDIYFTFGVASFSSSTNDTCELENTGVYTNVYVYLEWILDNIRV